MKPFATLLFFGILTGLNSSPIHIMEHEDAHYDKAADYGLNPTISYKKRRVTHDNGTDSQVLDIIGVGLSRESQINYELSLYHIPNHPYSMYGLYEFANKLSDDGYEYDELTNGKYNKSLKNAVKAEPFVLVAQLICNYYNSPVYFHSRHEIDRRGVVSYYSMSYGKGF